MSDISATLPNRRDEAWKWTDIRAAVKDEPSGLSVAMNTPRFDVPVGVLLTEGEGRKTHSAMGKFAEKFSDTCWKIRVPAGFKPIQSLFIGRLEKGHCRIDITLEEGAFLEIYEEYLGIKNGFSNVEIHITLEKESSLERVIVHQDPDTHTRVVTTNITAKENTKITQHALSFGGLLSRLETRLAGMGKDIEANIHGAYLLNGKRHADMTSYIDLANTGSVVRQTVKGVVTDKARGVFQGKFHVRQAAQHTDAEMRHDALMLSDTSEVRAKPELEIYADDVACAHGNTLGQLDETALFYMRQRGIPMKQARSLLTEAFVASAFDDVFHDNIRESLLRKVREWLGAQL